MGSGVAEASGLSGASVGATVFSPEDGRSGGSSQSMYHAATAHMSASTQQTIIVAILAARPILRLRGGLFPAAPAVFAGVFPAWGAGFFAGFFASCAPCSLPFIFMPQPLSYFNITVPCAGPI